MQSKFSLIVILAIAAFIAIVLAVDIGQANYEQLGIYATIGIVLYFFINGWRNVWWFTSLLIFSGVMFYQGFVFEADHLFVMMLVLASMMSLVSRGGMGQAPEFKQAGSRSTAVVVGALVTYGLLHFAIYYAIPYSPSDYAVKTSAKAYFECYASMACFLWLLVGPYGFRLKPNWSRSLILIITFALAMNVAARGYMYYRGFQAADGLSTGGLEDYFLYVPVINMQAGIYALRNLTPIACVILLMIATSPGWWPRNCLWLKGVIISALLLCIVGATFSGGRATLLFCIALILAVALFRRRVALFAAMSMIGVLVIAGANIFSYEINNRAPYYVARSFQMVMFDKGDSAATIEDSQEARNASIAEALIQFRKDNRALFFGRSVFQITQEDAMIMRGRGIDGFVYNAVRSGRTHNMITDLLLQYGLIGCGLYVLAYLAVIRFFFRLARTIPSTETLAKALAGAMAIYLPLMFVYQALGGTFMPAVAALMVGLVRVQLVTRREALPVTRIASQHGLFQTLPVFGKSLAASEKR
jgi:hypothetical protein